MKRIDPRNGTAVGLVPFDRERRGKPLVADSGGGGISQTTSEGHDEGSEVTMLDFQNTLFVGPFLDILTFFVAGGKRNMGV